MYIRLFKIREKNSCVHLKDTFLDLLQGVSIACVQGGMFYIFCYLQKRDSDATHALIKCIKSTLEPLVLHKPFVQ